MLRLAITCLLAACAPAAAQDITTGYLLRDADSLYYEHAGSGPALLLLHDGLVHSASWQAPFEALADSFHVIRFDRRGYGRSTTPTETYSVVEDVEALMDLLGVERAALLAASAGGAMAIDFTLARPERVEALVLVGAIVLGGGFTRHFQNRNALNSAPLAQGDFEAAMYNWLHDSYLTAPASRHVRHVLLRATLPYARKHLANPQKLILWHEADAVARLGEIRAPR